MELCNQALNTAYNYGYELDSGRPIDIMHQHLAAKNNAEVKYEDVTRIPGNLGLDVQQFINQLGTVFRELHLNRYLAEPEPTHFETAYSEIQGRPKEVFDAAVNRAYLQRKPTMAPRTRGDSREDDFLMNRVLAPKFQISYRVRGRTKILSSEISVLIEGSNDQKGAVRRKIIDRNSRVDQLGPQTSFFELMEEERNEAD